MDRKQIKEDYGDEPITFLGREYDKAIIGVACIDDRNMVCYDVEKCLGIIMEREDYDYDDASSFFNEKIENRSYEPHRPLFINTS